MTLSLYTPSCTVDCATPPPLQPFSQQPGSTVSPLTNDGGAFFVVCTDQTRPFHRKPPFAPSRRPSFHPSFVYLSRTRAMIHTHTSSPPNLLYIFPSVSNQYVPHECVPSRSVTPSSVRTFLSFFLLLASLTLLFLSLFLLLSSCYSPFAKFLYPCCAISLVQPPFPYVSVSLLIPATEVIPFPRRNRASPIPLFAARESAREQAFMTCDDSPGLLLHLGSLVPGSVNSKSPATRTNSTVQTAESRFRSSPDRSLVRVRGDRPIPRDAHARLGTGLALLTAGGAQINSCKGGPARGTEKLTETVRFASC